MGFRFGLVVSYACATVSLILGLSAAYDPAGGATSYLLIVMALVAEPSKPVANQVIWHRQSSRPKRCFGVLWYAACVAASMGLLYLLAAKHQAVEHATEVRQQAVELATEAAWSERRQEIRESLRLATEKAEEARSGIVPGVRSAQAARAALLARDAPYVRERKLLEQELNTAQSNAQREANARRHDEQTANLRKTLGEWEAGRPRTFSGRPADAGVRDVRSVRDVPDKLLLLALLSALLIELAIVGGVVYDTVTNASEAPKPPETPQKPELPALALGSERFETWLQLKWRKGRGGDGWLEGTQREWATGFGAQSPGFVHDQLDRLQRLGRIEKRSSPRKTWVRFVKVAKLQPVK